MLLKPMVTMSTFYLYVSIGKSCGHNLDIFFVRFRKSCDYNLDILPVFKCVHNLDILPIPAVCIISTFLPVKFCGHNLDNLPVNLYILFIITCKSGSIVENLDILSPFHSGITNSAAFSAVVSSEINNSKLFTLSIVASDFD